MARLSIRLLGPFQVARDGQPVTGFQSDKVRALLAYLAVESERPHRREHLAGLLWPERTERSARNNLSQGLFDLRRVIGDRDATPHYLIATPQTIHFNRDSDSWVDVKAFTGFLDACKAHSHPRLEACDQCMERLQEAVALCEGGFLAGFSLPDSPGFEEWALLEREQLGRLVSDALFQLVGCHEEHGDYESALQQARRLLELDPLVEEAHRQVMRVLAHQGQRSAVVAQYQACCRILEEELGVEPESETTALYERILAGEIRASTEAPSLPPHNLPRQLTPFVGRKTELAELGDLLADPQLRLVTVVGPGGMGKTRLALEAAEAPLNQYEHGVFFISLAPLTSAEAIVPAVADALGFTFYEGVEPRQQLLDYLRAKTMLLVLDNYEHLLEGASFVSDVLKTAPGVKALVTSRARLNLQGEQLFPLAGMEHPDWETPEDAAQYSAVELFLLSAHRVRPDFQLRSDDLTYLTRICRLVGGVPLGILLAAGWVDMLSPTDIATQIARSLDFLETETRDVPKRQRSMRAVFDHSWQSLTEREREVFQGLSVFRGGFTSDAARAVTGASLRGLRVLVNKSLVGSDRTGRYEIHELARQYAQERLDESPSTAQSVRDRHSGYYANALERWAKDLKGHRQQLALEEMRADSENVRTAWDWAVEHCRVERLDQAMDGLCFFYDRRGRFLEGEEACRVAAYRLAVIEPGQGHSAPQNNARRLRVLAGILTWQASFTVGSGFQEPGEQLVRTSTDLLDGPVFADQDTRAERARLASLKVGMAVAHGDWEEALRLQEQSLALYRSLGDQWGTAMWLTGIAATITRLCTFDEAKRLAEEGLELRKELGDQWGVANSSVTLSRIALEKGHLDEAEHLARESIVIRDRIGHRGAEYGASHLMLVDILLTRGEFAEAHTQCQETLSLCEELGHRVLLTWANRALGYSMLHLGQYDAALTLACEHLTDIRKLGPVWGVEGCLHILGRLALARKAHDEAQQFFLERVGQIREIGFRVMLGVALADLGLATFGTCDLIQVRGHLGDALRFGEEVRHVWTLVEVLPTVALLLADRGEAERAVELYALASRYPYVANSRWFEDVAGKHIAAVAATLPPDVVSAAQERGRARDLWETAEELLAEFEGNASDA